MGSNTDRLLDTLGACENLLLFFWRIYIKNLFEPKRIHLEAIFQQTEKNASKSLLLKM